MAELSETQVFEALGLGGKGQEVAEPAQKEQHTAPEVAGGPEGPEIQESPGEKGQEVAEPVLEGTRPASAGETPTNCDAETEPEKPADRKKAPMSEAERRENAARRRRAETQAAIDQAVEAALTAEREKSKREKDAFVAGIGLKNTVTGEPITTAEGFDEWKKAFDAAKLQKDLKAGKLTAEALDKLIAENPTVKRAEAIIRENEAQARRQQEEAAKARIAAELKEINKLDPSISEVQDLLHMPNAKEFYALVQKGNSFLDAFRLANFDRLTESRAEAARQQAMNNARSKDHLTAATTQRSGGATAVPAEDMAVFRAINPGATEAEIQAYYNNYRSK